MRDNILKVIEKFLQESNPYTLDKKRKTKVFNNTIGALSELHYEHCLPYRRIVDGYGVAAGKRKYSEVPPLAVRLFKEYALKSIADEQVIKILTSSGTTSQVVSKIFLDKETSMLQTKVLVHIMQYYLGKQRVPMLIIDHPNVVKDRASFSARGAGILGLSNFGRNHTYALDNDMNINFPVVEAFLEKHQDTPIFIFGFTFMVWQYFIEPMLASSKQIEMKSAILVHSGGWKKLQDKAVDNETFKSYFNQITGSTRVHNFYGMVEQVGSIYVECESGFLHAPNFSDINVLDTKTWGHCPFGEKGIIQVTSLLPLSYPGHKLLTEDIGIIHGEDDCLCGKKGKYFSVLGRVPKAEVRGCSDTHET